MRTSNQQHPRGGAMSAGAAQPAAACSAAGGARAAARCRHRISHARPLGLRAALGNGNGSGSPAPSNGVGGLKPAAASATGPPPSWRPTNGSTGPAPAQPHPVPAAPSPPSSAGSSAGGSPTSSRDGGAARGAKRLQQHAPRRETLSRAWAVVAGGAAAVARFRGRRSITPPGHVAAREGGGYGDAAGAADAVAAPWWTSEAMGEAWGRVLYRYYLWRQNTLNDLQLIAAVSVSLLLLGASVRHALIASWAGSSGEGEHAAGAAAASASEGLEAWWAEVYQVVTTSFGEGFPSADSGPAVQVFSVLVAVFGLAAFALVLALVEQVVLEANNRNVKRGSRVYETGHYLILGWCISQRDLEMAQKVVAQICLAYRHEGGTTVVVLTQREKLEMEELFRRAVPERDRHGTRLVFRQGSPLVPADLQLVSASSAGATVIISDQSRSPAESDAQVVRCAILLDELDGYVGLRRGIAMGHVVAEIQTKNALPLLAYSCSPRVVALPTGQLNARRLSNMVKRPFISWVSQRLFNFENAASNYVQAFPSLVGCQFGELPFRFPDASVYGVAQMDRGVVELNPPPDYVIREADQLVICRPTSVAVADYQPLPSTLTVQELEALAEAEAEKSARPSNPLLSMLQPATHGANGASGTRGSNGRAGSSANGGVDGGPRRGRGSVLVGANNGLGPGSAFGPTEEEEPMWPTMLDASPRASMDYDSYSIVLPTAAQQQLQLQAALNGAFGPAADLQAGPGALLDGAPGPWMGGGSSFDGGEDGWERGGGPAAAPDGLLANLGRKLVAGGPAAPARPRSTMAFIPTEYVEHDDAPEKVLICGWAGSGYMSDVLAELDAGTGCLPMGSEVVFVNDHNRSATLGAVVLGMSLQNVKVSHIKMDPLQQGQMSRLDFASFKCAIVLCDEHWVDPDHDESNGIESTDEPSMLRLDALMMTVQLNIRKCLADEGLPPINIICQKVATAGLTRFEDRHRLPLGISVNFTSFAAKVTAIVAYNPVSLLVYSRLGECADLTFVDAGEYVDTGEVVSYWECLARAQLQGDLLMGWYRLPDRIDEPIESVFNPQGLELRGRKRQWNDGTGGLKFIIIRDKECMVDLDEWDTALPGREPSWAPVPAQAPLAGKAPAGALAQQQQQQQQQARTGGASSGSAFTRR